MDGNPNAKEYAMSDERPTLTPVQRIELDRIEALIDENLRGDCPQPVWDKAGVMAFTFDEAECESPEFKRQLARNVQLTADLITYLAAEGIDWPHFRGCRGKYVWAFNGCSILRARRELFAAPDTFGFAVLEAAGFRPPTDAASRAG